MTQARRGSVYLAVVATVTVVTVLSLTGIALRKDLNQRARVGAASSAAHQLARSAAELAIHRAYDEPDLFIEQAATGSVFSGISLGNGSMSASAADAETDKQPIANTDRFDIIADAVVGQARSRLAFRLSEKEDDLTTFARTLGAIAHWPLDEPVNSTVAEDVIGSFHGTFNDVREPGQRTHVHGNGAPEIEHVFDRIIVPHDPAFSLESGTLTFWMYLDSASLGVTSGLIDKSHPTWDSSAYLLVYAVSGTRLVARLDDSRGQGGTVESTGVISQARWHHVAVSWNDELKLYINGVMVDNDSGNKLGFAADSQVGANTRDWTFGALNVWNSGSTPAHPTGGSVARVTLFDSDLSDVQVGDLFKADSVPGPIILEQGSFTRVVD